MVVCHHPHVTQGIEVYQGVPIIYSLGNYIFDQKYQSTMMSCVLDARVDINGVNALSILPVYVEQWEPKFVQGDAGFRLITRLLGLSEFLNTTIIPDMELNRGIVVFPHTNPQIEQTNNNIALPTSYNSGAGAYVSAAHEISEGIYMNRVNSISGVSGGDRLGDTGNKQCPTV